MHTATDPILVKPITLTNAAKFHDHSMQLGRLEQFLSALDHGSLKAFNVNLGE
jgi:hypothetical protein